MCPSIQWGHIGGLGPAEGGRALSSVAFLANKEPVDHLEDTYQPVDSFGAQQSNLD